MEERFKSAFSLMEMMIVLLIVAIVAAATAPMVTKKMTRAAIQGASSGGGLWIDVSDAKKGKGIAFNLKGDKGTSVLIGSSSVPSGDVKPKFVIKTTGSEAPIAFTTDDSKYMNLVVDNRSISDGGQRFGISQAEIPKGSIAFGFNQTINGTCVNTSNPLEGFSIVIGHYAKGACRTVSLGHDANALKDNSIAIGYSAHAEDDSSIVVGINAVSKAKAVSIGYGSQAEEYGIAIGPYIPSPGSSEHGAYAGKESIAIGGSTFEEQSISIGHLTMNGPVNISNVFDATSGPNRRITLGDSNATVYIPGNLIVGGNTVLGTHGGGFIFPMAEGDGKWQLRAAQIAANDNLETWYGNNTDVMELAENYIDDKAHLTSDRRLKNVGEKFSSGLAELKKLDLYHFTYKKDKDKTPHVGVMAQDLQKVFPDAVTKGDDGYLRIRLEDMFYAMINAIKEIDNKIEAMISDFKSNREEVTQLKTAYNEQQKVIEAQQTTIDSQQKSIDELVKRLDKLEKKQKKK